MKLCEYGDGLCYERIKWRVVLRKKDLRAVIDDRGCCATHLGPMSFVPEGYVAEITKVEAAQVIPISIR